MRSKSFDIMVGTLVHLHKKFLEKGLECEPLETALAAALLVADGELPENIAAEMEAIATVFFETSTTGSQKDAEPSCLN